MDEDAEMNTFTTNFIKWLLLVMIQLNVNKSFLFPLFVRVAWPNAIKANITFKCMKRK